MRLIRDMSIRYKLTLMLLGVVSVLLLAVSVANVIGEVRTTRVTMAAKYATLANIVAAQSGAALSIADIDASGAQQIVSDLAAAPAIRFAALYDEQGRMIAHYPADAPSSASPAPPASMGASFAPGGYLDVVDEVRTSGDEIVGRIHLRASTGELRGQIRRIVTIAVVVYLLALVAALLLSFVVQRFISLPILELARLTDRVSAEHDYSLAARHDGADELGALCRGFNAMLAEIRRRDDELATSNEELLKSNEELRQFAYVASHDLQEPLLSITSFCGVLKEECENQLGAHADDCVARIVGAAARMKALIMSLLSYSRVNADEQNPYKPVNMELVVHDALANLQGSLEAAGATISCRQLPRVFGDRQQLVQLLQNLIGNAILYRTAEPPLIRVEAERAAEWWEFAVADNGIGVAREFHEQIFEIFKRLHRRHEYPGTGIGLAVCKKIVERHGGRIWVESTVGEGSVFRFTLHAPTEERETYDREPELAATR